MRTVTETTKVGSRKSGLEVEYEASFVQFETVDEFREMLAENGVNGDEGILSLINAAQKQQATQGPKGLVRTALDEGHEPDSDDVQEAIAKAQEATLAARVGTGSRGGTLPGGMTKTEARSRGEKAYSDPEVAAEIDEILRSHGLLDS